MREALAFFSAPLLWPQLTLASGLLCCLASGMSRGVTGAASRTLGVVSLLVALWMLLFTGRGPGGPLVSLDGLGAAWQILFNVGALPVFLSLDEDDEVPASLLLGVCLGAGLLAASASLLMVFIGLELLSLPAYLLVARLPSASAPPHEASVKYFFSGALASCLFLLGMAFHYASSGSLALAPAPGIMGAAGLALMGSAALFKLGAAPFHFWLPDVYESSAPALAGFLSTSVKSAALFLLMRLASLGPDSALSAALPWIGALTALYGSLLALRQVRLQRLFAYSSVSHAGIMVLGVGAWAAQGCDPAAAAPLFFYGLVYLCMSNGAFLFIRLSGLSQRGDAAGYGTMRAAPAALFAVLLLSLAGIPPTGGFLAKLLIFWEAVKAGLYLPVAVAALASLVGLGYYLGLIRDMYFDEPKWRSPETETGAVPVLLWVCAAGAALLGVLPWVLKSYLERLFL
ncbi:MAG: NADH-quinone oxidoreductase subunit N [Elusimicrobiota bacterium]|jgi:NADH-quinone oxidoreductase subunit N